MHSVSFSDEPNGVFSGRFIFPVGLPFLAEEVYVWGLLQHYSFSTTKILTPAILFVSGMGGHNLWSRIGFVPSFRLNLSGQPKHRVFHFGLDAFASAAIHWFLVLGLPRQVNTKAFPGLFFTLPAQAGGHL